MSKWAQEGFWQVAAIPNVIGAAKMFGCSRVIAHNLVKQFEQTGISIDAQDRRNVRKQHQDKTVNLQSRIDVSSSSWQLWVLHTSTFHTGRQKQESEQMIFDVYYFFNFDSLLILTLPVKHPMLQLCFIYTNLPRIEHPLIWYDLFSHRLGIGGDITD